MIGHDDLSANRGLSEARVAEAVLLEQESIVAEDCCGTLRAHVWRDRVSLEGGVVSGSRWMV